MNFAFCSGLIGTQKDGLSADTCMTLYLQEKTADPKCSQGEEISCHNGMIVKSGDCEI